MITLSIILALVALLAVTHAYLYWRTTKNLILAMNVMAEQVLELKIRAMSRDRVNEGNDTIN